MTFCGGKGHVGLAVAAMLAALTVGVVSVVTERWFSVRGRSLQLPEDERRSNFHFGLWLRCYDDPPRDIGAEDLMREMVVGGDRVCVELYSALLLPEDGQLSHVTHLSRASVLLALVFLATQLSVLISMLCCACPPGRVQCRQAGVCCVAAVLQLVTCCAGIGSAISFLAARELEQRGGVYDSMDTQWGWSYVCMWGAVGCALVANFLLVCLVKHSPDYTDLNKEGQFYYRHGKLGEVVKAYWTEDGPVY